MRRRVGGTAPRKLVNKSCWLARLRPARLCALPAWPAGTARRQSLIMAQPAEYSEVERLRDGRRLEIRALRPDDRDALVAAVGRTSAHSLYRRFFAVRRAFTEQETEFFLNVDFITHVALVAVLEEDGRAVIVGGGRYIVVQPGQAEVAFAVVDSYQGKGIGAALMRHLAALARRAGLRELTAEVLPENAPMLKVFESSGLLMSATREPQVVHVVLRL
jgi:RimJ/RimL family protein N-acetyltransferase